MNNKIREEFEAEFPLAGGVVWSEELQKYTGDGSNITAPWWLYDDRLQVWTKSRQALKAQLEKEEYSCGPVELVYYDWLCKQLGKGYVNVSFDQGQRTEYARDKAHLEEMISTAMFQERYGHTTSIPKNWSPMEE